MFRFGTTVKEKRQINGIREDYKSGCVSLVHIKSVSRPRKLLWGQVELFKKAKSSIPELDSSCSIKLKNNKEIQLSLHRNLLSTDDCLLWYLCCLGGVTKIIKSNKQVLLESPRQRVEFPRLIPAREALPSSAPLFLDVRQVKWHQVYSQNPDAFNFCDQTEFKERVEAFFEKWLVPYSFNSISARGSCSFFLEE